MEGTQLASGAGCTILVRPNCSLTAAGRRRFLFSLAGVTSAIAFLFAWLGAWPVLPFAGLEVGFLVWAFREMDRHAGDYEKISICGDQVLVERCERGRVHRHEFNRHWARLIVDPGHSGTLRLRSHGREVEVGRRLAPAVRHSLFVQLRKHFNN